MKSMIRCIIITVLLTIIKIHAMEEPSTVEASVENKFEKAVITNHIYHLEKLLTANTIDHEVLKNLIVLNNAKQERLSLKEIAYKQHYYKNKVLHFGFFCVLTTFSLANLYFVGTKIDKNDSTANAQLGFNIINGAFGLSYAIGDAIDCFCDTSKDSLTTAKQIGTLLQNVPSSKITTHV